MKVLSADFANSVKLTSSALARVAYDNGRQHLQVEFLDGSVYVYLGVPPAIYHELLDAQSQGGYFNRRIRNVYAHSAAKTPLG